MWLLLVVIIALLIICLRLNNMRRIVQEKYDYINPAIQVIENAKDLIYYCEVTPELRYNYLSPVIDKILGKNALVEHLKNPDIIFDIVHPDDYETLMNKISGKLDFSKPIILRLRNDLGEYIWFEEYVTPIYENNKLKAVQGVYRNINDKMALQQQLEYKVSHDCLTDLNNRDYFESQSEYFDQKMDVPIALIIFDCDELKFVNDHYGHKAGDNLIKQTATILQKVAGSNCCVARLGGDEFAILLSYTTKMEVEALITTIEAEFDQFNKGNKLMVKVSKGFAYSQTSLGKMEQLYIDADNQMYQQKQRHKLQLV